MNRRIQSRNVNRNQQADDLPIISESIELSYQQWLKSLKRRGLAAGTQENYADSTAGWLTYCRDHAISETDQITQAAILDYQDQLAAKVSQTTVSIRMRPLRCYVNYLVAEGMMEPGIRFQVPRVARKMPQTLSDDEIAKLAKEPPAKAAVSEVRDWAVLRLLLATGFRRATLAALKISDLDFDRNEIHAGHLKAGYPRVFVLEDSARRALKRWLKVRPSGGDSDEGTLFCDVQDGHTLTDHRVSEVIRQYCRSRGVDGKRLGAHICRHTYAIDAIRQGMPLPELQRRLDHADISSTEIYTRYSTADLHNSSYDLVAQVSQRRAGKR